MSRCSSDSQIYKVVICLLIVYSAQAGKIFPREGPRVYPRTRTLRREGGYRRGNSAIFNTPVIQTLVSLYYGKGAAPVRDEACPFYDGATP